MSVTLIQPYGSFAAGATVSLDAATEASLVAQGRATLVASQGTNFLPLTAQQQQALQTTGLATQSAAQAAASQLVTLMQQSVAASNWLFTFGDSRAAYPGSGSQIGICNSGAAFNDQRPAPWTAFYLQDTDNVGDFGISGATLLSTNAWNSPTRANSKLFTNLAQMAGSALAVGVTPLLIFQYGINDLPSASAAALIAGAQSAVAAAISVGFKVCVMNIMTFDPTTASPNITPGNAAATIIKINTFRDTMQPWVAALAGKACWFDPNPVATLATSGYGNPTFFTTSDALGVHPNKKWAQLIGQGCAAALRTIVPQKNAKRYTPGPLYQPNLIDWGAAASTNVFATNSVVGTTTNTGVSWNQDPATGEMYTECIFTVTALSAAGVAQFFLKEEATGVSGATPNIPIVVGDVIQGSAVVTLDDGLGNVPPGVQSIQSRVRMFNTGAASQFFNDCGGVQGAPLPPLTASINGRMACPVSPSPIASVNIDTPQTGTGRGFFFGTFVEVNQLGVYRLRHRSPALTVVSGPQPINITAGASPYTYQNNPQPFVANDWVLNGPYQEVCVTPGAGGTITQVAKVRGPSAAGTFPNPVNTGATGNNVFTLKPGDGLTITWATTAPVLTVTALN